MYFATGYIIFLSFVVIRFAYNFFVMTNDKCTFVNFDDSKREYLDKNKVLNYIYTLIEIDDGQLKLDPDVLRAVLVVVLRVVV